MIKLVYAIRRRPDFTPEAFRKRWLEHGPLVRDAARAIRARRYVQSHTLDTPLNAVLAASRGMGEAFDGITEVWWDSMDEIVAGLEDPASRDAQIRLLEDERKFIDLEKSFVFLTEEHSIFDFSGK